jgi:hypothetical protein
MNKEENQCFELSETTMNILDNDVLVNLFVSTQKNNLELCIGRSIEYLILLTSKNIHPEHLQHHLEIW